MIAARLRDLFAYVPNYDLIDLHLLKIGRHFRLSPGIKIILGRDQPENEQLQVVNKPNMVIFRPADFRGPICLAFGALDVPTEKMIGEMMARYSQEEKNRFHIKRQIQGRDESVIFVEQKFDKEKMAALQIDEPRIGGRKSASGHRGRTYAAKSGGIQEK